MPIQKKKPLLVSVPSRNKPEELRAFLEELTSKCKDRENFDIQIVVDKEEVDLYDRVIKNYDCIKTIIPYSKWSWRTLFQAQHEIMRAGGYYFFCFMADDVSGISQDWDEAIVSKKGTFKDDLFVLYSETEVWGRNPKKAKACYIDDKKADGTQDDLVGGAHEVIPVSTYKFLEFIRFLFEPPFNYNTGREYMIAELLRLLCLAGYNRNVFAEWSIKKMVDDDTSSAMLEEYDELEKRDFDDLKIIVRLMVEYIKDMEKWSSA